MNEDRLQPPVANEGSADGGIYRGRRQPVRGEDHSPVIAPLLSFVWPGLGHVYVRRFWRAIVYAVPPAILVVLGVAVVMSDPGGFALNLLGPAFALVVIGLIAAHGLWRVAAIFDAWRTTRRNGRALADRALPLAVLLSLIIVAVHVGAGLYVQSFPDAGSRIFTSDRPTGPDEIDDILGGSVSPGGSDGAVDPNPQIDVNGDGVTDASDDINGDGVANGDDIDAGDINGDGVVDENDVPEGDIEGDTNGDGVVDENDLPEPGATPGPSFDPGLIPPPIPPGGGDGPPGDGPINVLFVGLDSGLGRDHSLSDSLIVASYYPSRGKVTMISFPRDTGRMPLYTGGIYPNRINTFLGYANRHPEIFPEGPVSALMRELGYVLGIQIHYYAATNLDGLPPAVDAVGGVDVVLERPIADPKWNLYMDPGRYHLNGQTVMPFVRSRYGANNSDWVRARRQQTVIKGLAARVKDPFVAVRLPQIIDTLSALVRTNVPRDRIRSMVPLLEAATDASTEQIVLSPPGGFARRIPAAEVNGRYMTELNIAAVRELSIRVFGPYSRYH